MLLNNTDLEQVNERSSIEVEGSSKLRLHSNHKTQSVMETRKKDQEPHTFKLKKSQSKKKLKNPHKNLMKDTDTYASTILLRNPKF